MLYAIGDLHLSLGLAKRKPMDIFGGNWKNHHIQIRDNWINKINNSDTVLLVGDTSWAMAEDEFKADIDFIHDLPGNKVIINGNHDYWWNSTTKLNAIYPEIYFMKNTFYRYEGYHICGTRGWVCPNDSHFTLHDLKIYNREVNRLKLSLDSAMLDGAKEIIVMIHYPPFNDKKEESDFVKLIKKYPVNKVIYGHLHGAGCQSAVCGKIDNIDYQLVSSDYIKFNPVKVVD